MLPMKEILSTSHTCSVLYHAWRREYPPLRFFASVPLSVLNTEACEYVLAASGLEKWLWFVVKKLYLHEECKVLSLFRIVGQCYSYETITCFALRMRNIVHYFTDMEESLRVDGDHSTPFDHKCFIECLFGICTSKKPFERKLIIDLSDVCLTDDAYDSICILDWDDRDYPLLIRAFQMVTNKWDFLNIVSQNCNTDYVKGFITRLLKNCPMYRYSILNWFAQKKMNYETDLPMEKPLLPLKQHLDRYTFGQWSVYFL